jgi:pimeloyl-ACP methyl ester carboxylesterase
MPDLTHAGRRFAWREAGAEAPGIPVLFAHCSLAHSGLWKPILSALAPERPVRAVDMPAHGASEPPPDGESLQLHALGACLALMERIGRPMHLVGLSLGGAVLGRAALKRPDLVQSVTLIEPVWFHLLPPSEGMEEERSLSAQLTALIEAGDAMGGARLFVEKWGAPGGFEKLGPEGQAYAAHCLTYLARDFAMVNSNPPGQVTPAQIAGMVPPALLVAGGDSPPQAHQVIDAIAAALPSARRHVIPGAGHLSPVTHWPEVLEMLRDFFALTEAAPALRADRTAGGTA